MSTAPASCPIPLQIGERFLRPKVGKGEGRLEVDQGQTLLGSMLGLQGNLVALLVGSPKPRTTRPLALLVTNAVGLRWRQF